MKHYREHKLSVIGSDRCNSKHRFVDLHGLLPNADSQTLWITALLLCPKVCLQDSQAVLMEARADFTEDKEKSTETMIPSHTVARQYVPWQYPEDKKGRLVQWNMFYQPLTHNKNTITWYKKSCWHIMHLLVFNKMLILASNACHKWYKRTGKNKEKVFGWSWFD